MNKNQNLTERELLQQKFNTSRMNLLLMLAFTAVNIVLFFAGSGSMLLFSASIPYYAVIFGAAFEIPVLSAICYIIAGISVIAYLLCWLLSKKRIGWLIPALVLFVLDSIVMVLLYVWARDFSGILDALFHVWVLYYLIVGITSGSKLKKLPQETEEVAAEEPVRVDPEHWAQ